MDAAPLRLLLRPCLLRVAVEGDAGRAALWTILLVPRVGAVHLALAPPSRVRVPGASHLFLALAVLRTGGLALLPELLALVALVCRARTGSGFLVALAALARGRFEPARIRRRGLALVVVGLAVLAADGVVHLGANHQLAHLLGLALVAVGHAVRAADGDVLPGARRVLVGGAGRRGRSRDGGSTPSGHAQEKERLIGCVGRVWGVLRVIGTS